MQLPIQRQYLRVQMESIGILLDLFKIHAHETFEERLRRKVTHASFLVLSKIAVISSSNVVWFQAVEDFVGEDQTARDDRGSDTKQWDEMTR